MQGRRGGRDNFFGFGGPFSGFGGFGGHGSLISSVFGGSDPFDDPFFTRPFEGHPFGSMFGSSFFGAGGSPFVDSPAGFLEHQPSIPHAHGQPQINRRRGPVIEHLDSDEENAKDDGSTDRKDKRRSGKEPYVGDPNDDAEEESNKNTRFRNEYSRMNNILSQPQSQSFSFHSSTVTYGGANGSYYTKSSTRRTGSDGVTFEENKEADSTTGRAFHQVSRGLHNKGHTIARNLNSDGKVDTMQTLHNLNEDELAGFEEAWKGKAKKHLPGLSERLTRYNGNGDIDHGRRGGWALPSNENPQPQKNGKKKRARKEAKAPEHPRA
ncbi:hypothetical protein V2J09_014721 [Rumex salicifolius]